MKENSKLSDYVNNHLSTQLAELTTTKQQQKHITIDYLDLLHFDHALTEELLEDPTDFIREIKNLIYEEIGRTVQPTFINVNLPPTDIWSLRTEAINTFVCVTGTITKLTIPEPKLETIKTKCPRCEEIATHNIEKKIDIDHCKCGRKGKQIVIDKKFYYEQSLIIQEDAEEISDARPHPRTKKVVLKEPLSNPSFDKQLKPGKKVKVAGTFLVDQEEEKENKHYTYILAHSLEVEQVGFGTIKVSKQEEETIKNMAKSEKLFVDLANSILPFHQGDNELKEAIFLSLVGGRTIMQDNIIRDRGNINILMIGGPGRGKSQIIKHAIRFSPIHKYVSCTAATAIGITGTITRDKELDAYVPSAGVLPLCNNGFAGIDELDKIEEEELGKLNTAITELRLPVDKADVHYVFETNTTIIAGCNPTNKEFDSSVSSVEQQIPLPPDFKDRFDLIFPMLRQEDVKKTRQISEKILSIYGKEIKEKGIYDQKTITQYLSFVRRYDPVLTEEAKEHFLQKLEQIKKSSTEHYFTHRLEGNIQRIATAYARARFKDINKEEIDLAISLLMHTFRLRGILNNAGELNLMVIEEVEPLKKRIIKTNASDFVYEFCKTEKTFKEVQEALEQEFGLVEHETDNLLNVMSRKGDIFSRRHGFYTSVT